MNPRRRRRKARGKRAVRAHKAFMSRVANLRHEFNVGPHVIEEAISDYLSMWEHINTEAIYRGLSSAAPQEKKRLRRAS